MSRTRQGWLPSDMLDYNEIFFPVVKHIFIWILLAIVAQFDLELEKLDIKIAFLHGELEEKIYMK